MSRETDIQWCDSTVNPIMGCAGCELFPSPESVLAVIDQAVGRVLGGDVGARWGAGQAKKVYRNLIFEAFDAIPEDRRKAGHKRAITTTNLWHLRERFVQAVRQSHGAQAAEAARGAIAREVTCYAAKLHLNKGLSILKPERKAHPGYAPAFEQVTQYAERVQEAAGWEDLRGKSDPDRPWIDGLPRLIFVSDMGDALSRDSDFTFLEERLIAPIQSESGRRHLWLWLTKRPDRMARFAERVGGFPDNVCAMTTVASREHLGRIDDLRQVKAEIRGLSIEPLFERLPPEQVDLTAIDWLILGGESGAELKDSRPFAIEWAEELRQHCRQNGVAFFLKQLGRRVTWRDEVVTLRDRHGGEWGEWPEEAPRVREFPKAFFRYRDGEGGDGQTMGLRRRRKGQKG